LKFHLGIVLSISLSLLLQTFHQTIESWFPGTPEEMGWKPGFVIALGFSSTGFAGRAG